ncbi:MAG: 2-oxoacid:acceptor oxidoreductase family protein [Atopobiaceae bacterium]|jgi:2-oxoglutarate ferredoxin oxidoreductase subunit gamma|nr:2-oxoacid:acceptor oxidoreductase family protein [Atopobiaceae bacterium]
MADFNHELLCVLSGFGGQGLLFAGKIMANCGLIDGRQVSWMPSYGPEMRGGTANCSVSLSDDAIGTPFITKPTALIAMNQPSVEKFAASVQAGGSMVIDTTLAMNGAEGIELADGVTVAAFKATELAEAEGLKGLANIICLGKLWSLTNFCERETVDAAIAKCVPPKRQHLLEPNLRAFQLGIDA